MHRNKRLVLRRFGAQVFDFNIILSARRRRLWFFFVEIPMEVTHRDLIQFLDEFVSFYKTIFKIGQSLHHAFVSLCADSQFKVETRIFCRIRRPGLKSGQLFSRKIGFLEPFSFLSVQRSVFVYGRFDQLLMGSEAHRRLRRHGIEDR